MGAAAGVHSPPVIPFNDIRNDPPTSPALLVSGGSSHGDSVSLQTLLSPRARQAKRASQLRRQLQKNLTSKSPAEVRCAREQRGARTPPPARLVLGLRSPQVLKAALASRNRRFKRSPERRLLSPSVRQCLDHLRGPRLSTPESMKKGYFSRKESLADFSRRLQQYSSDINTYTDARINEARGSYKRVNFRSNCMLSRLRSVVDIFKELSVQRQRLRDRGLPNFAVGDGSCGTKDQAKARLVLWARRVLVQQAVKRTRSRLASLGYHVPVAATAVFLPTNQPGGRCEKVQLLSTPTKVLAELV